MPISRRRSVPLPLKPRASARLQPPAAVAVLVFALSHVALAVTPAIGFKTIGEPQPFDYARLKAAARELATKPYSAPRDALPAALANLTWDQMQQIRFRDRAALWRNDQLNFRVRLFSLGLYNKTPVRIHEVRDGQARELAFDSALFDYGRSGVDSTALPADLGFAGFQLAFHTDWRRDVAAFQGASYFRAVGESKQYGLSARGLAIDCGLPRPEEFPRFTSCWLERPPPDSMALAVYAMLDSPSVTGAYRFLIAPGEPLTMDIDATIYPRKAVELLGIAPLTSMFLCGENDHRINNDFRPEIHDSDGLALWTGGGEWIWRPLVNPAQLRMNSFRDDNPRGFGLVQRDRLFDHYQDAGADYHRRPSLWVEPKVAASGGGWGKGAVRLVEIPTNDETFDNVVAFWVPDAKAGPNEELKFSYRLSWGEKLPATTPLAATVATRTGVGGAVGQKRDHYSCKFVVDFAGGELGSLPQDAKIEPVVSASRGRIEVPSAGMVKEINGCRATFDLRPTDDSVEPIDLRLFLRRRGQPLTETWLYQWTPPAPIDRKF